MPELYYIHVVLKSFQIVSQYSSTLAPIAVSAVSRLVTPSSSDVDLRDIRIVKKVGGTIEDTELIDGVVLNQTVIGSAGGPNRMEKAKIGLIQFQLSPPKPDVRHNLSFSYIVLLIPSAYRWIIRSLLMITARWTRF